MNIRNDDKEIDGVRFSTQSLPPMTGFVLSPKLMRVVGPLIAAGGNLSDIGVADFVEGFMRYNDAERVRLTLDTLANTTAIVGNERIELTSEGALNKALPEVSTLFKLLWWVIGFNFFPSGLAGVLEAVFQKVLGNHSTSPISTTT